MIHCVTDHSQSISKALQKLWSIGKKKSTKRHLKAVRKSKKAFENPAVLKDLGTSLHRDHGLIFNHVHQE